MIQLYALMKQPLSDALIERFPNAVVVGPYRLGVFVDGELDSVAALSSSFCNFIDELNFTDELAILTYEQAKEISLKYSEVENEPNI